MSRARLAARKRAFERHLAGTLRKHGPARGRLAAAMRYAALSPGKRLRPLLTLAACEGVGGAWRRALPAAAAIECVHAFSLVHDDLPAIDDDDYRRGRLTTHKRFGEALGILAGDALLAFAFEELARSVIAPRRVVESVSRLAWASGGVRLVAGQVCDLEAEGRRVTRDTVAAIHYHKTGGLMGAALALGAIAGGASAALASRLERTGSLLGLAFQVQDDLLNSRSTLRRLGKRPGTDAKRGKATFPRVAGEAESRAAVVELLARVDREIRSRCRRPAPLIEIITAVAGRER